jgi:hypothetical protein
MEPVDHRQTASYGRKASDPYMQAQRSLTASGNFMAAVAMHVADIRAKFPDGRYDAAIAQMMAYSSCLKATGQVS